MATEGKHTIWTTPSFKKMAERGKLGEGMDQRAEKGQGVERGKGIEQDQSIDLLRQDQGEEKDQCVDQDRGVMRGLD